MIIGLLLKYHYFEKKMSKKVNLYDPFKKLASLFQSMG